MEAKQQGLKYLTAPELEHQSSSGIHKTRQIVLRWKLRKIKLRHSSLKPMILQKSPPDLSDDAMTTAKQKGVSLK